MIALFTALVGFLSSLIPSFFKMWEKSQDYKHEKELLQLRLEALGKGIETNAMVEEGRNMVAEGFSLREHDMSLSGNSVIETLRASVRPVITYATFGIFCFIKAWAAIILIKSGQDAITILNTIWGTEDVALLASIMGFWFGSRSIYQLEQAHLKMKTLGQTTKTK